jgi:heme oxygenase (staphylobilin-producing)
VIVATNTIKIKAGHIDAVAERFKNPKGVQHTPGFLKMELLKHVGEEYDELKVCTTWESKEAFDAWVSSDAFKQAHARPGSGEGSSKPEGQAGTAGAGGHPGSAIMLGAKLSIHEVIFQL